MKCKIEGCTNEVRYAGLCGMHYKRQWRHGDATKTLTPTRGFKKLQCKVEDCEETSAYSVGYCERHYNMWNTYGRTHNIIARRGEGSINAGGYVVHTVDGKRVYEHIMVAEKALGKPLPKGVVVHHMNNKPWDNYTPYNLVICPDQAYHLLLHRRMKELGYEGG